jgi:hypothetical protein
MASAYGQIVRDEPVYPVALEVGNRLRFPTVILPIFINLQIREGIMSSIKNALARLEKLISLLGGDRWFERVESQESRVVVVHYAGWIEAVWKRYKETLKKLGAYPVYDPEPSSGYDFIRDIHLPFTVNQSEAEAAQALREAGVGFECSGKFHIVDGHETELLKKVESPGDRIVSLYDTKVLYEERRSYLEWERDHPFSDDSFVFWHSHRGCKNSREDRKDLIETLRTRKVSEDVSVEELMNFMAQWHRLFLEDSKYADRLFPNLGSGDVHCRHFDHSLSFAFRENDLVLEAVDIQRGFLRNDNAVLLKV